jgi:hypothetical protein
MKVRITGASVSLRRALSTALHAPGHEPMQVDLLTAGARGLPAAEAVLHLASIARRVQAPEDALRGMPGLRLTVLRTLVV